MSATHDGPTETSPLLPNAGRSIHAPTQSIEPIEPSGGIVPGAPGPGRDESRTPSDDDEDIEGQGDGADSNGYIAPYEGMPDVKKQMIYLFPALGIGVCIRI
jgi:hypothetical protein